MASKASVQTLDLKTISQDVPITIDGTTYGIRHPDSLSLIDYKHLETAVPRIGHLMLKAKLTTVEAAEAKQLLIEVADVILDAPAKVRSSLRDVHRAQILDVFLKLRPAPATKTEAPTRVRRRTGESSFPR